MFRGEGISPLTLLSAISYLCLAIIGAEAGNSTDGMCGPLNGFAVCSKASHCCSRYGYCGNGASHCSCESIFQSCERATSSILML